MEESNSQKPKLKICGLLFIDCISLSKQNLMYSTGIQSNAIVKRPNRVIYFPIFCQLQTRFYMVFLSCNTDENVISIYSDNGLR